MVTRGSFDPHLPYGIRREREKKSSTPPFISARRGTFSSKKKKTHVWYAGPTHDLIITYYIRLFTFYLFSCRAQEFTQLASLNKNILRVAAKSHASSFFVESEKKKKTLHLLKLQSWQCNNAAAPDKQQQIIHKTSLSFTLSSSL